MKRCIAVQGDMNRGSQSDDRFCRKLLAGLRHVKDTVRQRYQRDMEDYDRVLGLALQEAEAIAWQTRFPHLFFPTLAEEKAQAVSKWARRQRQVQN